MNKVIKVTNEKAKSLIYTENSVRFIGKEVESIEKFNEIFNKKISMVDKGELKFSDMKKLTVNNLTVNPHAGMKLGNSVSDISFLNESDKEEFIAHVSNIKGWSKKEVLSSPFNAIKWYLFGIVVTPVVAYFMRGRALEMEAGTYISANDGYSRSDRRGRMADNIVEMIGSTGLVIIASLVLVFFAYMIYKSYKNPPLLVSYE